MFAFVSVALQPPPERVGPPNVLPWVVQKFTEPAVGGVVHAMLAEYFTESAKYASSAVTRLRRSDFIEAMYAFALVLANFGIAIAAKMPMITTTIRSSMSVKPLRFILVPPRIGHAKDTFLYTAEARHVPRPGASSGHDEEHGVSRSVTRDSAARPCRVLQVSGSVASRRAERTLAHFGTPASWPPGGPCLFWNAALVPTERASAASDVAPARGTLSSGMEPPQAREQRVGRRRVAVCQGDRRFAPIVPAAASMTQPVKPREQRVCAGRIPGGK